MKYKEQQELVRDLRALADFYGQPESIVLPKPYIHPSHAINEGEWSKDYSEFHYDHEASLRKIKKFVKALGSCTKDWSGDSLYVKKQFGKIKLSFSVSREAVCEKKVVEVKKVPKRRYVEIPGEYDEQEVVEWECTDVSLLS